MGVWFLVAGDGWQQAVQGVIMLGLAASLGLSLPAHVQSVRLVVDRDGVVLVQGKQRLATAWADVAQVRLPRGLQLWAHVVDRDQGVVPVSSKYRTADGSTATEVVVAAARERGITVDGERLADRHWVAAVGVLTAVGLAAVIGVVAARLG